MDCNGFSFDAAERHYSGEAAIPKLPHQEGVQRRRVVETFLSWTYRLDLLGERLRDVVGLSPVSVVSQCDQVTPCTTLRDQRAARDMLYVGANKIRLVLRHG